MLNLYVSSTRKNEGKTFIAAGIAATMQSLGYKTAVYKPIQTGGIEIDGFMQSPDLTFVKTLDPYIDTKFTYLYKSTDEPLIASEEENNPIDIGYITKEFCKVQAHNDCVILDGDCGIFSPLAPEIQTFNMVRKMQVPLLFVVSPEENSINDILLSIYAVQDNKLKINGVIINNFFENGKNNKLTSLTRIIEEYTNVKVLGLVPNLGVQVEPEDLITGILNGIDIESIFNVKIEKLELR